LALPAHTDPDSAWRAIRDELRAAVTQSTYEIWLARLELEAWDQNTLALRAPPTTVGWVSKRFSQLIERTAAHVLGCSVKVVFAGQAAGPSTAAAVGAGPTIGLDSGSEVLLNPRYTFDQFIIGDGNRMAHAASLVVAENPGQAYNPLFLYAPPGMGKTHLLHAIGNYVLAFGGGATVRYATAEAFTNHFISSLAAKSLEPFKRAYRDTDVLLIDDVQFLANKAKTIEEFFHTFNALYESGRQLVLTCDRLPNQLTTVEDRLRERFQSGLVADIAPPDLVTRTAILRKRAKLDRIALAEPGVLELIAERVSTNVRALEAALIRVVAYHSLTERPIDAELANTVLDVMYPRIRSRVPTIADIQASVAVHHHISIEELKSASRAGRISWARQVAIHLARQHTGASLSVIGQAFGGRNHATVLHACRRVAERITTDPEVARDLGELSKLLGEASADRDC
jgi:chromosomal replication initiator protein